jgi:hypothetical protein
MGVALSVLVTNKRPAAAAYHCNRFLLHELRVDGGLGRVLIVAQTLAPTIWRIEVLSPKSAGAA